MTGREMKFEVPHNVTSIAPSGRGEKEILLLTKRDEYEYKKNLSEQGYQFERLVTSNKPLRNKYVFTLPAPLNLQYIFLLFCFYLWQILFKGKIATKS